MKKETHGFHNYYAWFPSVSLISNNTQSGRYYTGLRSLALWAHEAPLISLVRNWKKVSNGNSYYSVSAGGLLGISLQT